MPTTKNPAPAAPVIKIPPEVAQQLRDMEATVDGARRDIATLKKLGLDTKALEEKLEWADEARKTLLTSFA